MARAQEVMSVNIKEIEDMREYIVELEQRNNSLIEKTRNQQMESSKVLFFIFWILWVSSGWPVRDYIVSKLLYYQYL